MKIYINNFNLDILNDIANTFKEHKINSMSYIDLYTDEGIYRIEEKNIYILVSDDKSIKTYTNYYNNMTLILDPSYFIEESTTSIHGKIHLSINIREEVYKLNKNSDIELVLKYSTKNTKMYPCDIYFQINKDLDINDIFIKKEIIEFLSVLN